MNEFRVPQLKAALRNIYGLAGVAIGGIVASPLSALIFDVGPPWPPGVVYMTALANLVIVIVVFLGGRIGPRALMPKRRVAQWILPLSFIAYMMSYSLLVRPVPGTGDRIVKGFYFNSEAATVVRHGGSYVELLKVHGFDAEGVWEPWSIAAARLTLLLVWFTLFGSFSILVSAFVLGGRRRLPRKAGRARGSIKSRRGGSPNPTPAADGWRRR